MNDRTEFPDVKRRLQPGDVFRASDHDWNRQGKSRWRGTCPFCDSDNDRIFTVDPAALTWHCFKCERGGGPLHYAAEHGNVGMGARSNLKGEDFFRAWDALADHAGCEGPPELDGDGEDETSDRSPRRKQHTAAKRTRAPQKGESASTKATAGGGNMSRDIPPRGQKPERKMKHSEQRLRNALLRYRDALSESEKARAYVGKRGLSVETLRAYGCGFAPPGEWLDDDITNENGTHVHRAPNGRIVTPHTTPDGRLVCLSGRAVPPCPDWLKKRHLKGHTPALFNASAIAEESGPLVLCEGPFDALSFIEAGYTRAIALHNTGGVPWTALRGNAETLVFAFDADDTGREDAVERAQEAAIRGGFDPHTLHDEDTYAPHGDPNEALQRGALNLSYLRELKSEGSERSANGRGSKPSQSPTAQATSGDGANEGHTAAALVLYWNGDDIGHLGRWLWERGGVPDGPVGPGDVGAGLYADRELHEWIKETLEAGPHGTTEQDRIRLRWVLWRLYATHGPEDVPAYLIPERPDSERDKSADTWDATRSRDPYAFGRIPAAVEAERTTAPKSNPHPGKRGIALDAPYDEAFVHDLKTTLPSWGREWRGSAGVWVVDDSFAAFAGDICRDHFGR